MYLSNTPMKVFDTYWLLTIVTVVRQASALTVWMSFPSYRIPGRSGFAFHSCHNSKASGELLESGRVHVAGSQCGGSGGFVDCTIV